MGGCWACHLEQNKFLLYAIFTLFRRGTFFGVVIHEIRSGVGLFFFLELQSKCKGGSFFILRRHDDVFLCRHWLLCRFWLGLGGRALALALLIELEATPRLGAHAIDGARRAAGS